MARVKVRRLPLLLFVVAVIAGAAYVYFQRDEKPTNALTLYGNVDIREVQLAFNDNGRISKLLVQEGDRIKRGQLVAELDPVRYEAAAARARATAAAQQQVLARLLAGSRPEQIAAAKARVRAAQASLQDVEQTYRRTETLARTQYVSRQKLDNVKATLKSARANLDAQQQALTLAEKGPRQEDIDVARDQLQADQAALKLADRELADTKLYAPVAGVFRDRILEPGDMAFPQTPVVTIALAEPLWVRTYVPEPDLGKIAPGMRAQVTTDSFPGKVYRGWIGTISPTAEFTPKQVETTELRSKLVYQVRVYVINAKDQLRLGMPATVTIPLQQSQKALHLQSVNSYRGE